MQLSWQMFQAMLLRRQQDTPEMGAISLLSPHDASALFPPLRRDFGALHVAGGARVDGRLMAAGLLRAAQRHGATVREGHAELSAASERVTGVHAGRRGDPG